jgi:hypothetical protein
MATKERKQFLNRQILVLFFVETSSPHANFCLSATIKGKTQNVLIGPASRLPIKKKPMPRE